MTSPAPVRCAIYTRNFTEKGLEQRFNTLDAQHETCAAYVASQKHEGWRLVRDRHDNGGFSGGNTDRPALQRLLAEVDAGRIGMIVSTRSTASPDRWPTSRVSWNDWRRRAARLSR